MKRFFKRFAAPVCALACVLVLAGAWTGVRLSADAGTYRLDTVEGDPAYLDGVSISMRLSDAVHTQHITLNGGILSHSYEYQSPFAAPSGALVSTSQTFVEHENADAQVTAGTSLEDSGSGYENWVTRMTRAVDTVRESVSLHRTGDSKLRWVQVPTDVTVSDGSHPFIFDLERYTTVYTNQISADGDRLPDETSETPYSYTSTEVKNSAYADEAGNNLPLYDTAPDGTIYFTPALRPYHGGSSGIYRVDEWGDSIDYLQVSDTLEGHPVYFDYNAQPVGRVTQVAAFPVDGHRLRTIALNVVDDRLCLLLVVDGVMTLRVYSLDGALQSETALFDASPSSQVISTLYRNKDDGATLLCYSLQEYDYDVDNDVLTGKPAALFGVRLGDKPELMAVVFGRDAVLRGAFINGHWVLGEAESMGALSNGYYVPNRFYISVLSPSGTTLYRGEVVTDALEDMLQYSVATGAEYAGGSINRWLYFDDITEG